MFLALSYRNTKNIWLPVAYHGPWDYIFLSEIGKTYTVIDIIVVILMVMELMTSLFMLKISRRTKIIL